MKRAICLVIVLAVMFAATASFAASEFVTDSKKAGKATAAYSGDVVKGTANTVGYAADGTVKTAVSPFKALWNWMTGKGEGQKVVTEPVNTGGKTVYNAAVDTGKTVTGQKVQQ